jgi:hypothetical protein
MPRPRPAMRACRRTRTSGRRRPGTPPGSASTLRFFDRDRVGDTVMERIRPDVDSGLASGQVLGTPTLFIDGVVHRGGYDPPTVLAALAAPR